MTLIVNGEARTVRDGVTVRELLDLLGVRPDRVAVEVNLDVVRRADHPARPLREGDAVEIVSFVGGG